jgi:hypothetical protein
MTTTTGHSSNNKTLPYSIREEIVYNNGLLLKGQHIIIPSPLRSTMETILHQGHTVLKDAKIARNSPSIGHLN